MNSTIGRYNLLEKREFQLPFDKDLINDQSNILFFIFFREKRLLLALISICLELIIIDYYESFLIRNSNDLCEFTVYFSWIERTRH